MSFSTIDDAVAEIREGRMIIIVDDEDRENEGDLVCAAEKATPEIVNFMARHGRGLICLALTAARVRELELPMMVSEADASVPMGREPFTVSIAPKAGGPTGTSAPDRARSITSASAP